MGSKWMRRIAIGTTAAAAIQILADQAIKVEIQRHPCPSEKKEQIDDARTFLEENKKKISRWMSYACDSEGFFCSEFDPSEVEDLVSGALDSKVYCPSWDPYFGQIQGKAVKIPDQNQAGAYAIFPEVFEEDYRWGISIPFCALVSVEAQTRAYLHKRETQSALKSLSSIGNLYTYGTVAQLVCDDEFNRPNSEQQLTDNARFRNALERTGEEAKKKFPSWVTSLIEYQARRQKN